MPPLNLVSASGQVAAHLREKLTRGQWTGTLPGVNRLALELGVNRKTIEAALKQLEWEGLLAGQGVGRKRLILESTGNSTRPMRVGVLLYEASDRHLDYVVELQHALVEAGHAAIVGGKTLTDLKMNVPRIAQLVKQTAADAWLVMAGAREVLEWFCQQPLPAFAVFGRWEDLPMAAIRPDKPPAYAAVAHELIRLGHRRIVFVARKDRRLPKPGASEQAFLDELKTHGILTGTYNLPDWEETPEGFQRLLAGLFKVTPPTALIIDEAPLFVATQQFLAGRGIRVPQTVSLICTDPDTAFAWCHPAISHIRWESHDVVLRILKWAGAISRGRKDKKQSLVRAEFLAGGTIGPVPAA